MRRCGPARMHVRVPRPCPYMSTYMCACAKAAHQSRIPETENVLHTRNVARARTCVLYGETWPYVFSRRVFGLPTKEKEREHKIRAFPPGGFFSCFETHRPSSTFIPSVAHSFSHSFVPLSLRHNCCNLRSRAVDLTALWISAAVICKVFNIVRGRSLSLSLSRMDTVRKCFGKNDDWGTLDSELAP